MILGPARILDADGIGGATVLELSDRRISKITATAEDTETVICPALLDLQVNGGGGVMVNAVHSLDDLRQITAAHRALGSPHILPTLISDTPQATRRCVDLVEELGGFGLHLEGPHLAIAGAHDPDLLRPMEEQDLLYYLEVATRLPHLMITLAPEHVNHAQIERLSAAGIVIALGHSRCSYETGQQAMASGARMITHLFNAMSGLHHRTPGLVGAGLDGDAWLGLIADGHHVHDAALRLVLQAAAHRVVPVSDAMALTGSRQQSFPLQGRQITADGTRLALADGTLAGAKASLLDGLRHLARITDTPLTELLHLGFDRPWRVLGHGPRRIETGSTADLLRIRPGDQIDVLVEDQWRPVPAG